MRRTILYTLSDNQTHLKTLATEQAMREFLQTLSANPLCDRYAIIDDDGNPIETEI